MLSWALFSNPISISFPALSSRPLTVRVWFKHRAFHRPTSASVDQSVSFQNQAKSSVHHDSLRVLEWDKLCDCVASFARTALGREATKAQLWSLNQTYDESLRLLCETNAAVEMHKHGDCSLDFSGINVLLVKSAIQHARRSLPMEGDEAMAVVSLLQFAETLQVSLKAAVKEDADWYRRFMPLTEVIMRFILNRSLVKLIKQVIDEDGSVKDSASPTLKRSRDQVRTLEKKIYQLMDSLIRNERNETSSMEVYNIDGRWCIRSSADQLTNFKGLLLPSNSGIGSIVEPFSAVPLNDELQQARASVAKAEADVLSMLTLKMQMDLDDIEMLLNSIIQLDVVNARATYSLSFGGTCPNIFLPGGDDFSTAGPNMSGNETMNTPLPNKKEWVLYLPKAYHPLLLHQHSQNLRKARKDFKNASAEIRSNMPATKGEKDAELSSLKMKVSALEQAHPVPVDFFIAQKTRVLVITGPNTGGKTICLKTVGLTALMAKSGLHVLSSESVHIPWFDSVFADIGDEQSLSQSLSTFSGHLKQISNIQLESTSLSLVLLDEVGAGTNPLEGAALGMSILEYFAETGALLTIATTHHGELKTLKYSNDAFENACMEFDEVNLKPTYKILWGIPGRSNAINIADRLGLPGVVVEMARELYGAASAEIDEVIIDMERLKQEYRELLHDAQDHFILKFLIRFKDHRLSKDLYENLLAAKRKIEEHARNQRFRKTRVISETATMARSILNKKVRQLRASAAVQPLQSTTADKKSKQKVATTNSHQTITENRNESSMVYRNMPSTENVNQSPSPSPSGKSGLPKVGDVVHVSSLGRKGTVLKADPLKEEILVQAGMMKLKVKLIDVER